jgi:DNA phosphorothioation system restriction enzyme
MRSTLKELSLPNQFRSDCGPSVAALYEECLPVSSRFDRAAGFFAASSLTACARGFSGFFSRGGVMRLVTSPVLELDDMLSIARGLRDRPIVLRELREGDLSADFLLNCPDKALCWLVAKGAVAIKIALPSQGTGTSIYHEKIGVFLDADENSVAYSGSSNESLSGLRQNFESIEIFRSWRPQEVARVRQKRRDFYALWSDETDNLRVYSFAEAAKLGLLQVRPERGRGDVERPSLSIEFGTRGASPFADTAGLEETLQLPPGLKLRDHQKDAIRAWFEHGGRGILEMATGSGKTIAALAAAVKFYEYFGIGAPIVILIVCPYIHLVAQWRDEAVQFGLDPVLCMGSSARWTDEAATRLMNLTSGGRRLLSAITTNATFSKEPFQRSVLERIASKAKVLFIADEVHNLGASDLASKLPMGVQYRLGLSATPERAHDETGTAAIRAYFGESVFSFSLADALRQEVLCPYEYHPIPVRLTETELDEYLDLTSRLMWYADKEGHLDFGNPKLKALLLRRARLLATASEKIPVLVALMSDLKHTTHNLVYCGDGSVEAEPDATVMKQIDLVVRTLGVDLDMTVGKYVAETPLLRRESLRRSFTTGTIQALVAIRCLDEGVDIPEIRRAFILASSTNPRQFIQRRGRILRRAENKDMAWIFDFLVVPPIEALPRHDATFEMTRGLVARELHRVAEFADLAVNGPEAFASLLPIREQLDLVGL